LALPETEHIVVLEGLLESISPDPPDMTEDEFFAELQRRREELAWDPSQGIPWSEVKYLR
jgi:putative addiction module component (TIGR02574 family)